MSGTAEGGKKAAETNKRKYGEDYYSINGAKGGAKKVPKGFALMDRNKLIELSTKGGTISRRTK